MVGKTISYYGILEKLGEGGNKTVTSRSSPNGWRALR